MTLTSLGGTKRLARRSVVKPAVTGVLVEKRRTTRGGWQEQACTPTTEGTAE
jgi:hypothetical protein